MFFYLHKSEFQLVATNAFTALTAAERAFQFVFPDYKFAAALPTSLAPRAELDFQMQSLELGTQNDGVETESQGFCVDSG
jgi:hypothetical protein